MPLIDTPLRARLWAVLRQRCPRCCRGPIFAGRLRMHEHCPVCGLRFGREPGYFFGAMYASYFLSCGVLGLFTLVGYLLLPWRLEVIAVLAVLLQLPLLPALFRYSRVIWIHFDRFANPLE